jgi:hypothetical protein
MDKKKTLEDEHEKPAVVAAPEKQIVPDKKDGPQTASVAGLENGADPIRRAATLQRELGNARLGRMLAAQQPAEDAAAPGKPVDHKAVTPIQLEQEKGKGHV